MNAQVIKIIGIQYFDVNQLSPKQPILCPARRAFQARQRQPAEIVSPDWLQRQSGLRRKAS